MIRTPRSSSKTGGDFEQPAPSVRHQQHETTLDPE